MLVSRRSKRSLCETLNLKSTSTMSNGPWRTATGEKLQAPSNKLQAPSVKQQAPSSKLKNIIESLLDPGPRISKREACAMALGPEIMDLGPWNKFQAPLTEGLE